MSIKLAGFPTNLGFPAPQRRRAPAVLRELGAVANLAAIAPVQDLGDLPLPAGETLPRGDALLRQVLAEGQRQADWLRRRHRKEDLWVTLGGDHSTSLGTALGLHQAGYDFDVVWVDAHADFNTPATSPSGNPHGMVLALLGGLTPLLPAAVAPGRMYILGARAIDPGEQELLARHGVHVFGVAAALANRDAILRRLGARVFLSLDMDALDPALAPAVRTPVPGGFTLEQARFLVAAIGTRRHLLAIDLVEYYPDLDPDGRTGAAAVALLAAAAHTQAPRLRPPVAAR